MESLLRHSRCASPRSEVETHKYPSAMGDPEDLSNPRTAVARTVNAQVYYHISRPNLNLPLDSVTADHALPESKTWPRPTA